MNKEKDLRAYVFLEEAGPLMQAAVLTSNNKICKFRVDVMQEADLVNRNRRIYDWDLLVEGCNSPFIQERLATSSLYCEQGHPTEMTVQRQLKIERTNSACMIKKLFFNKPYISAELETLSTDLGRDLKGLIVDNGVKIAFSMRSLGKGKLNKDGITVVQRPFRVVTWDEVLHPSVSKAYLSEILQEEVVNGIINHKDNEKRVDKLVLNEEEAGRFYLESSDYARKTLNDLGCDPDDKSLYVKANRDGSLLVKKGSITYNCFCEAKIERALRNYLLK